MHGFPAKGIPHEECINEYHNLGQAGPPLVRKHGSFMLIEDNVPKFMHRFSCLPVFCLIGYGRSLRVCILPPYNFAVVINPENSAPTKFENGRGKVQKDNNSLSFLCGSKGLGRSKHLFNSGLIRAAHIFHLSPRNPLHIVFNFIIFILRPTFS